MKSNGASSLHVPRWTLIGWLHVILPFTAENCQLLRRSCSRLVYSAEQKGEPWLFRKPDKGQKQNSGWILTPIIYFVNRRVRLVAVKTTITYDFTWGKLCNIPVWRAGTDSSLAWWGLWAEQASLWLDSPGAGSLAPLPSFSPSLHPSSPSHPPAPPVNDKKKRIHSMWCRFVWHHPLKRVIIIAVRLTQTTYIFFVGLFAQFIIFRACFLISVVMYFFYVWQLFVSVIFYYL